MPIPIMAAIETPCAKICIVDEVSGLCRGCGRSLTEIERGAAYSGRERSRIMSELPRRIEATRARQAAAASR